ncbi:hypothetical protein CR513_14910, partial [Mucuna pruriens]
MTVHLFHNKRRMAYPMKDFKWSWIKTMSKHTRPSYPKWDEREDIIIKCGGFPNVPLMGNQGGINYNPELVPRQAGHPMILPPLKEATTPFVIYGMRA